MSKKKLTFISPHLRTASFNYQVVILMIALSCVFWAKNSSGNPVTNLSHRDGLALIAEGRISDGISVLEQLAVENDPSALLELADLYSDSHYLPLNLKKSSEYIGRAVSTGDQKALWKQAYIYNDQESLEALVGQGYYVAACSLRDGSGLQESYREELCYQGVKSAAISGDDDAIFALGVNYDDPIAPSLVSKFSSPRLLGAIAYDSWIKNPSAASLRGLIEFMRAGSRVAPTHIISTPPGEPEELTVRRRDLIRSLEEAVKSEIAGNLQKLSGDEISAWFSNDFTKNFALGKFFKIGFPALDLQADYQLAYKFFGNCSRTVNAELAGMCFFEQGALKRDGGPNLQSDYSEAFSRYMRAHDLGNMAASAAIAASYRNGMSVSRDFERAAQYSEIAVQRGNVYEPHNLALQYKRGLGVEQDLVQAEQLFRISATEALDGKGIASSMVELGRLHELGGFESANLSDALEFYESALQATESSWAYVDGMGESAQQYRQQAKSGKQRVTERLQGLSLAGSSDSRSSLAGLDFGTYHVLIVANQSYDNIASLTTPRRDAALVGSVLESKFDASVEYLFDATRTDLLSALNRYRKSLGPSDNFILYYAGHGVYDEELKVGYWQPIDATPQDDYTWVDTDRISRTVSGFKSRNALVIADSCFSGSVVRGGDFAVNESNSATALLALNGKKTRMAITSGGLQPVLDVTGNSKNSAFASNLASALNAVDRPVPISLLFPQIRSSVTAETAAWGFEQIPEMAPLYKAGHDGGDFILSPQIQASN